MKITRVEIDGVEYYAQKDGNNLRLFNADEVRNDLGIEGFFTNYWPEQTRTVPIADTTLQFLPPVARPGKVICVGRNYLEHVKELGNEPDGNPLLFTKYPSNMIGHNHDIEVPAVGEFLDYEVELAVVIGKTCYKLESDAAVDPYIFGYTVANDLTYRDIQKSDPGKQWTRGKGFEQSLPIGPWLVPTAEVQADDLEIWLTVNGENRQISSTKMMIFSIDVLIRYISQFTRLEPGDIILTGTPSGVGFAANPPITLDSGDEIACGVENIGELRFRIK